MDLATVHACEDRAGRYTLCAMPIYQYDCHDCRREVEIFFRSVSAASDPICPECGGSNLTRLVSQFARVRSDAQRLAEVDFTEHEAALERGDERGFAQWARKASAEYDEVLGSNYRELAEKAEAGEDPVERIDAGYTFRHKVNEAQAKRSRGNPD